MSEPFFSVLVTAYNRAGEAERCVRSCMGQTFTDLEIVVVDDGSTDGTGAVLAAIDEPRLRVVRHERNRGISAARGTAVDNAQGEWLVILDSDWELFPHTLARLDELIATVPAGVRIIRSRMEWDDGHLSPGVMPRQDVTDYVGRLEWLEAVALEDAGSDAGHCMHRLVFETTNYYSDRRGSIETLWELDLARRERSLWVPDILTMQHTDAANSNTRDANLSRAIPRLVADAPDRMWMGETMLAEHGDALARYAPHYFRWLAEFTMTESFLAAKRRAGLRHTSQALRAGAASSKTLTTAVLGLLGPSVLAYAKLAGRQWRARQT